MNSNFKPMLAAPTDIDALRYPLLASPKLDGVRAIVRNGVVLSRSLKKIPNHHVQTLFSKYQHYDGELIVGSPTAPDVYRKTMSGVMSAEGAPDVHFMVFDHTGFPNLPYEDRFRLLESGALPQSLITCQKDLLDVERRLIDEGYEGLILRDPRAPYKFGRSTTREGYLLKLKRYVDAEFDVVGFEERMANNNEARINALGHTERSSHAENKVGRGDLGALVCALPGGTFNVGTGFDDAERLEIWENKDKYLGKKAKIKYFPVGMKDAPRHPVFLGWRHGIDV